MNSLAWFALCSMCWIDLVTTGYCSYLQALFGKKRVWEHKRGGGVFQEAAHTQQPLCLAGFLLRGGLCGPFPNYPLCVCEHGKEFVNMAGC